MQQKVHWLPGAALFIKSGKLLPPVESAELSTENLWSGEGYKTRELGRKVKAFWRRRSSIDVRKVVTQMKKQLPLLHLFMSLET